MPARTTRTEEPTASRKSTRNKMTPSAAAAARAASLLPTSSPSSKKKSTRQCPVETAKRTTKSETTASPAAGGGKKKQPRSPLKPSPASKKAPDAAAAAAAAADAAAAAATVTTKKTKQALALYDPHADQRLGRLVLIPHVADAVANANSPNWVHGVTTEARLEEGKSTGEYFVCLVRGWGAGGGVCNKHEKKDATSTAKPATTTNNKELN